MSFVWWAVMFLLLCGLLWTLIHLLIALRNPPIPEDQKGSAFVQIGAHIVLLSILGVMLASR